MSGAAAAEPGAPSPAAPSTAAPSTAAPSPAAPSTAAPSPAPTAAVLKEAGERYERGLKLYGDGEFLLALVEFERAYQLSDNYRVLYNIGQVRIQLGRYAKAKEALEAYLTQGGSKLTAERAEAVRKDLATLAERTATLSVKTNQDGADISLDGKVIGTSPLAAPVVVDAGEHSLVLHKSGFYDKSQSLTLAGHDDLELSLDLAPISVEGPAQVAQVPIVTPAHKTSHTAVYVSWAATGVLAATAGVVGYFGVTKANDLDSLRGTLGATRDQLDSAKSSARTLFAVSDVATGLAAVAGGVALYLTLTTPASEPSVKPGAPALALGFAADGVRLRGSF
jgi:hypothetical protein